MSSRITRARANPENPQTTMTEHFKPTRIRSKKKLLVEDDHQTASSSMKSSSTVIKAEKNANPVNNTKIAPLFEKKSRSRARTPSRQVELNTPEVTGTPPKKTKENSFQDVVPALPIETPDVILDNPTQEKSALDVLMEVSEPAKKKTGIRTVAEFQSRLAAKGGAARAIHAQNSKNKAKVVDEHAEMLKSPKKKAVEVTSPTKSKAARTLFSPKKSVPDYVLPNSNVVKSAEKVREEQDDAHDEEEKRMTAEFLKNSKLIDKVKESVRQRIELPSSFERLVDSFKRLEQITAIFIGQNRKCVASEVFKNVSNSSGSNFSNSHLAQILYVYPEAYHVEMCEQRRAFGQGGKYELEIRPNLVDDVRGYIHETTPVENDEELPLVCPTKLLSPKKSPRKHVQAVPRQPQLDGKMRLDAARQRDRGHIFRHKLTTIVMDHHEKFLETLGLTGMKGVKRLHPLFRPDKHCPDLPQMTLPEPPIQKSSIHIGMKEALELQTDVNQVNLPTFVQKVMNDLKSPQKSSTGASGAVPVSPKKFSEMQAEQKNKGGMSLLERIRAKEAIKKAADSFVDKDLEKRKLRLTLLKERYVRIVCNHFTSKGKKSIMLDNVAKFVQFSSSTPSTVPDITDHLKLMCEVAPMYVTEIVTMGTKYLRFTEVNKNNMEAINELILEELEKTQEKIDFQRNTQITQMSHTPRPKAARSLKFH